MADTRQPDGPALNDEADALEVLRALVSQIAGSGYRDRNDHAIEMNVAYLDAVALLQLRGLLGP